MRKNFKIFVLKCCKADRYSGLVGEATDGSKRDRAYRIVADHLRAACIMVADGVKPGSRNRGLAFWKITKKLCTENSPQSYTCFNCQKSVERPIDLLNRLQPLDHLLPEEHVKPAGSVLVTSNGIR